MGDVASSAAARLPGDGVTIHHGDCVSVMAAMPEGSIDAIVCDPPYGLEFMGKEWDKLAPDKPAALRSGWDKPGMKHGIHKDVDSKYGKGVAYHTRRGTWACPSCGKRDGFRNAHGCGDVEWRHEWLDARPLEALAMQQWHEQWAAAALRVAKPGAYLLAFGGTRTVHRMTVALEDAGWIIRDMLVWGYASGFPKSRALLKPAWEPIVMARKPGPLRDLDIEGCRIGTDAGWSYPNGAGGNTFHGQDRLPMPVASSGGRWPANVVLTDAVLDEYSRFFLVPKASRSDREPVMPGMLEAKNEFVGPGSVDPDRPTVVSRRNVHPTVKPIELMRHLVRLVTPAGGTVLDPFLGSGTTALAAEQEGRQWVGIEREAEYVRIAEARLSGWQRGLGLE
jgi:DNA modification methylase